MSDHTHAATGLFPNLSAAAARHAFYGLATNLPPHWQIDGDETAEDRAAAALEQIRRLDPQDSLETDLALFIVAAIAHAKDGLRLAAAHDDDTKLVLQCRAQAASMMRQALNALRTFRPQVVAEWAQAAKAPAAEPPPEPALNRTHRTEVERYAIEFPDRARRIRASGGLPDPLDFDPPRHSLVMAIVKSDSPILHALDPPLAA
jgi:hypothetical protein